MPPHKHSMNGPGQPAPQGPSLRSGLFCPSPSSLNRPHPPHSQARPDFAGHRLIQDAFAVREHLGNPRVVPSFRLLFFPDMSPSMTPEVQVVALIQFLHHQHWPSRRSETLGILQLPQSASRGARDFGASMVRFRCDLPGCSSPFGGSDRAFAQPTETFTSRLSMGWSPAPSLDITTAATGQLCRWVSHPLEQQLASLHQIRCDAPAQAAAGSCQNNQCLIHTQTPLFQI
jgi:hypothetical protein